MRRVVCETSWAASRRVLTEEEYRDTIGLEGVMSLGTVLGKEGADGRGDKTRAQSLGAAGSQMLEMRKTEEAGGSEEERRGEERRGRSEEHTS